MMSAIATMLTCHWSARRIQRYLDSDPATPLEPGEVRRLEAHLATCESAPRLPRSTAGFGGRWRAGRSGELRTRPR
jgi:hypothetical protein